MEKFNLSIPVTVCPTSVFSAEDNSNKVSARARVRIFYKGLNRNGTYITDTFAEELIKTLPYTPLKGIYTGEDYSGHGEKRSEGRIYGVVPADNNFAWEDYADEDGIVRTYACTDVIVYTALYEEATEIIGKSESMELYVNSIEGSWQVKEGKKCFVFEKGCFLGLQILGDDVEPCFEGAAIYSFDQDIYSILNGANEGDEQMEMETLNNEVVEEKVETFAEAAEVTEIEVVEETTEVKEGAVEETTEVVEEEPAEEAKEEVPAESVGEDENKFSLLESKIAELEGEIITYVKKQSEDAALLEQYKASINSLTEENNALKEENSALCEFKAAVERKQKEEVINQYQGIISEDKLQEYRESIDSYTVESLDMNLCYEIKKGNPSVFFSGETKIVPKPTEKQLSPLEQILERY